MVSQKGTGQMGVHGGGLVWAAEEEWLLPERLVSPAHCIMDLPSLGHPHQHTDKLDFQPQYKSFLDPDSATRE